MRTKGLCVCRKCGNTFHQSKIKKIHKEVLGIDSIELVCPRCESFNFGLINYRELFSLEGVYKTSRFFNR